MIQWHDCEKEMPEDVLDVDGRKSVRAMASEALEGVEFLDLEVYRLPQMDKYYKLDKSEMDWLDPEDRIALVKDAGFRCEYVELEECKQCPAREYCSEYEDCKQG